MTAKAWRALNASDLIIGTVLERRCHLPKYYTFGFGMVFKFLGQLLKQSNVFGNKITRFGVNG